MSGAELPYAFGGPLGGARLRQSPEDFRVDEVLGFEPSGQGEHLLVRVRKRGWTTEAASGVLARAAGVPRQAVSYAGMKDKWAVTEQWFSVHLPGRDVGLSPGPLADGIEVVTVARHDRKLRRGALKGNRFRLVLREVQASADAISRRLYAIQRMGVPNYFGEQRFGRDGDNVEQARAMLAGRQRVRDRGLRGILLSAARSHIFNKLLAERLRRGDWNRPLAGDLMMLDGRHSLFPIEEADPVLVRRAALQEIHPTGPMAGPGGAKPALAAAAIEAAVLADEQELIEGLARADVEGARRALRLRVAELSWRFPEPGSCEIGFFLTAGAYATVVVRELFDA